MGGGHGRGECLKVTRMKIIEVICRELKCIKSEIERGCLIGRWMWNEGVVIPGIGDMFLRGVSGIFEVGESRNLRFRGSGPLFWNLSRLWC